MWYVGLDWADTHHDVAVLNEAGKQVGARRFSHTPQGLSDLKQFLLSFASSPEELICVMETTHGLLITFPASGGHCGLSGQSQNDQWPAHAWREPATDQIDAHLLAKIGFAQPFGPAPIGTR